MRISIAELDRCQRDVAAWVREKLNPRGGGPRLGYAGAVKLAIYRLHKGGSSVEARAHLQRLLDRFQNEAQKVEAEATFEAYIGWFNASQPAVAGYKVRLGLPLTDSVLLGGEVSRVDVDIAGGGYRTILLGSPPPEWATDLRLPLVQLGIAALYQRPVGEVSVGFQELDGSGLRTARYTDSVVYEAREQAAALAERITAEWLRQGGMSR